MAKVVAKENIKGGDDSFGQSILGSHTGTDSKMTSDQQHEIISLNKQLKNLEERFKKSREEICDLYTKVSGEVNKIGYILDGRKDIVTWNKLEDMALVEPDDSAEF